MLIQCPSCDRTGKLPTKLFSAEQVMRCRKCGARFTLGALPLKDGAPQWPELDETLSRRRAGSLALVTAIGFSAHPDDAGSLDLDPDDSSLGFSMGFEDDPAESHYDLPALPPPAALPAPPRVPRAVPFAMVPAPRVEALTGEPSYVESIARWGRFMSLVALGVGAFSVAFLGLLLVSMLSHGQPINWAVSGLILGFIGLGASLLISLNTTVLNSLLFNAARAARRQQETADRSATRARPS